MSQTPQDAPRDQPPYRPTNPPPPYGAPSGHQAPGYPPPSSPYGSPYGQQPYSQAPYGQAPYGQAPYGQGGYAGWGSRVGASLLDSVFALPAAILVVIGFVVLVASAPSDGTGDPSGGAAAAGGLLIGLGYLAAFGLQLWNRVFRQGRTGQSWGKKVVGIRLVAEHTGQPVGAGLAFGRELCHVLDGFFYLGYLWPLWDEKRQTFADKICTTVVAPAPKGR